jgi:uncharacterized protein with NRDE domain
MCLLAINFRPDSQTPILLAANREESYDRRALPPHIQLGCPRVICGIDKQAGGTWLGVNEFGLLVAVTNRRLNRGRAGVRSRGLLCRDLLNCQTATQAIDQAMSELAANRYAGVNVLGISNHEGGVIYAGNHLQSQRLESGLHVLTNGDLNDFTDERLRRAYTALSDHVASANTFLKAAATVCAISVGQSPIVIRMSGRGTVSSSLIALTQDRQQSRYLHAEGPPDESRYVDYSSALRDVFDDS